MEPATPADAGDLPPLFRLQDGRFLPTPSAGSPWTSGALHGGPPAALLARAIEAEGGGEDFHIARITIDLFRPVPSAALEVRSSVLRDGNRIRVVGASLFAGGLEVSRATGLFLRQSEVELQEWQLPPGVLHPMPIDTPPDRLQAVLASARGKRPPASGLHGFHTVIEARLPANPAPQGAALAWLRVPVPVVEDEPITPLVRAAATADFGNALGGIRASQAIGFINADITIYLHRLPEGEWLCLETRSLAQPHGLGVVETTFHDQHGPFGRILQAILANRRAPTARAPASPAPGSSAR